ncbi:MAG: dipeptidase, partial [Erysipelotrichales bacterium]|nr:dipeptidase [Erysipelotrichales bacterium]
MDIKKRVEQEVPEIIKNLRTLVSYPSVLDEPTEDMPFGKANAECLNAALKILSDYGFQTKNVDNYAGYAEIGSG